MTMTQASLVGLSIGIGLGSMLWAGGVASSKQRSVLLFGLLGLLFHLLGVAIALLVSPKPTPPAREPHRPMLVAIRASSR